MKWVEISAMPTVLTREAWEETMKGGCKGIHESCLRSFNVLQEVKSLLYRGVEAQTILKIIEVMEYKPDAASENGTDEA